LKLVSKIPFHCKT